jgi:lysophospholipase L1-like esterase
VKLRKNIKASIIRKIFRVVVAPSLFLFFVSFYLPGNKPAYIKQTSSSKYNKACVQEDKNAILNPENLKNWHLKTDALIERRTAKVNIVHIGDSHIQADVLTHRTRMMLQRTFGNGGRGFIFPYRLIRSNSPLNLKIRQGGQWSGCQSTRSRDKCNFGITGASAATFDSTAYLMINPNRYDDMDYSFDRMKLFHYQTPHDFEVLFRGGDNSVLETDIQPIDKTTSLVTFQSSQDSFMLTFDKSKRQNMFQLFGMSLENNEPGVLYHSIGLNGAYLNSYLRNQFFDEQLQQLHPDLIIISLGTNDGYMSDTRFCIDCFKKKYRKLLKNIQAKNPNASILLTTPGDYYRKRRYHNKNNHNIVEVIKGLSEEFGTGVWDFNSIMGGEYSIRTWHRNGLSQGDLIHYTLEGYLVQGELLYEALMDSYEQRFE